MKFDTYTLFARAIPALLSSVPFFVFHYFLLSPAIGGFWNNVLGLKITSDITFSVALLYLLMHLDRIIAKEFIEERIYKKGLHFPTTNFLLHLDGTFSPEYTKKIHKRIKEDFEIIVPSSDVEMLDGNHSRKLIYEAMNHIRLKVGKGNLVGQHNAEYGFIRNFAGGAIVATFMSIIDVIVFLWIYPVKTAFGISLALFFIFGLLALFSKKLIDSVGYSYAKVLIQEYMR